MIRPSLHPALCLLILGSYACCAPCARAALGAAVNLETDSGLHGAMSRTALQQYDVEEIADGTGMRVREYVDRAGVVFAVAWSGPAMPDLRSLLGTHFPAYAAALAAMDHPGLHRSVRVASRGLVVEAGGHLRAYFGRAYLPPLVPAGAAPAELR